MRRKSKLDQAIHIGNDALAHLLAYCERESLHRFTLVADENTFAALGKRVHEFFQAADWKRASSF
jgi:glycerol dehydrogenase-like iron-containing ADH family enzyme